MIIKFFFEVFHFSYDIFCSVILPPDFNLMIVKWETSLSSYGMFLLSFFLVLIRLLCNTLVHKGIINHSVLSLIKRLPTKTSYIIKFPYVFLVFNQSDGFHDWQTRPMPCMWLIFLCPFTKFDTSPTSPNLRRLVRSILVLGVEKRTVRLQGKIRSWASKSVSYCIILSLSCLIGKRKDQLLGMKKEKQKQNEG